MIVVEKVENASVIRFTEPTSITRNTHDYFENEFNQILSSIDHDSLILNMKNVLQIDSYGIGELMLMIKKMLACNGVLILSNLPSDIGANIKRLGIDKVAKTFSDEKDAIKYLSTR